MALRLAVAVLAVLSLICGQVRTSTQALKSGIDLAALDRSVRPQDDLYRFANGAWLRNTDIPPDRVTYGTFAVLAERAESDARQIIESLRGGSDEERQIRAMYDSMVNDARVEALGGSPIRAELQRIDAIDSPKALARQIGRLSAMNAGGPFTTSAGVDAYNPTALVATVTQGGTLLPERRYYFEQTDDVRRIREQYVEYLAHIFSLAERTDPAGDARAVVELETILARSQAAGADVRASTTSKAFKLSELSREMPGFEWREWAKPQGLDLVSSIVLEQPDFFRAFAAAGADVPLSRWKAWLVARYITASSIFLSRAFADARFEFFGRVMAGQEVPRDRWKRGVSMVNGFLGDAMGRLYVREHFSEESRRRVSAMVRNIVNAYREAIADASWMTADARRDARAKLDSMGTAIGYPDRWRRYDDLRVEADDLLGNAQRGQQHENAYQMTRLQRRFEPRQWLFPPQTVNAYYTPSRNEIILPAALLQPPIFDPAVEDAANYGAIGAMIGHEITHAFDQRGRRFDGFGRAADWWTAADEEQFNARALVLVQQFDGYIPLPGSPVNGRLTLVENVADLAGLAVAVRAYRASRKGQPSPVLDGFTGDQRLFIAFAQTWRERVRDEYLRQTLLFLPYAPSQFRANGVVSNLPAFYEAFGVVPGDRLYRDPRKTVRIW